MLSHETPFSSHTPGFKRIKAVVLVDALSHYLKWLSLGVGTFVF